MAVKRSAAIRIRGKKWHGLKASFTGALIPAFLPEMVEQDKPDATVHVLPADLISPVASSAINFFILAFALSASQITGTGRDGSALLEAEANSHLLLLFSSSSFIPRRKMTRKRLTRKLKKTDSKIHVVEGPYEWYHGSVKRLHT